MKQAQDITSLPRLKRIEAGSKVVDAKGLEQISSLETLIFGGSEVKNTQYLSGLKNLGRLLMTIKDPNPNIQFLGKTMTNLTWLTIYADESTWGGPTKEPYQVLDLTSIGNLPHLESLELRGFILKNVAALDKLEYFNGAYVQDSILFPDPNNDTKKELTFYYDGR